MEQGIEKELRSTALKMKEEGFDAEMIAKITGLPIVDIEKL